MESIESKIKRYKHSAETYEEKGKREWAYAKNGQGGVHYKNAKYAFERAKMYKEKEEELKRSYEKNK